MQCRAEAKRSDGCLASLHNMASCFVQVKRLWEKAVFLAQRNMAVKDSAIMLKALQPIFGHWVAELAQIAAHAETLHAMWEKRFREPVLSDLNIFGRGLGFLAACSAPSRPV